MNLSQSFQEAQDLLSSLNQDPKLTHFMQAIVKACADALQQGAKILCCGNGGSACDAAHFCEELVGRFRKSRPALAALALNDAGTLTCIANDFGYDEVYARQVEAYGKEGDIWIGLSTSGQSKNIILAAERAKKQGLKTCVLLGKDGGQLKDSCDYSYIVPGKTADRIQELHMLILHIIVEGIEKTLFPDLY
eukprot:COSAG01_NODE_568_length_15370_cov_26.058018_16_plen_192_part_00